ncbi:MAG: MFS transporter [Chloroflexi bacterium]|nr:MFS transporter [Chloroflexota bacterium]
MKLSRKTWLQIISSTLVRTVYNTGFRMVFPFQPMLMKGFGINLEEISRMYAGQSLVGIFSPLLASIADTKGRRTGMLAGMVLFSLGTLVIVLQPTALGFFMFLVLSMLAKAIFEPSLQAYFGDTIPYERRGFVLGITEISWSLAFFVGVPVVGFFMSQFNLVTPFIVMAILGILSFLGILLIFPPDIPPAKTRLTIFSNFGLVFKSRTAMAGLIVMMLICLSNQLINVVFGVWLNDSFGLQIAALGGASAVIGLAELIGEGGVIAIADKMSKQKAVAIGIVGNILASAALPFLGSTDWGAFLGLFVFYLTFEFTIVTMLPLMTGLLPVARGTLMAVNVASANLGRGLGSLMAAPMYLGGFWINALFAALVNLLAIVALRYVIVQEES